MIEDYRALAVFVVVADVGSFSGAGRRLNLSTSVVSHHISKLEAKVGATLFFRSTRAMTLTSEGQAILASARRMVTAGDEALDTLIQENDEPVGALRIAAPAFGDRTHLRQAIWEFAGLHPMVSISLNSSDHQVDLVKDGIDLAIRIGVLKDSRLTCRRIADFRRVVVASPDYLAKRSPVRSLEDLKACEFVAIAVLPTSITLEHKHEVITFEPENIRLEVDTITAAKSAILAGLGVQHLPLGEVKAELDAGDLIRVLPSWSPPILNVYAVWPNSGPQKKLTRRLIDFLLSKETVQP